MPELSDNTGHPSLIKTDRKGIVSDDDMWTLLKVHFLQGSRVIVADDPFPIHPNLAALSIKPQNSEIELHDQYSTNFYGLSLLLKLLIPAFRGDQERPNVARNGYRLQSVHGTLLYAWSIKTPKLNCKTNTQPIFMI